MQYEKLLLDATECEVSASQRSQHVELTRRLNAKFPEEPITLKGVAKWSERRTIPAKWLFKIAQLRTPSLNLSDYA